MVESKSINTTKRILKQQNPHSWSKKTNSARLCTVELIHRRRCDSNTLAASGATVCACASLTNFVLYVGKCFKTNVVRYRSSPR